MPPSSAVTAAPETRGVRENPNPSPKRDPSPTGTFLTLTLTPGPSPNPSRLTRDRVASAGEPAREHAAVRLAPEAVAVACLVRLRVRVGVRV